MEPQQWMLLTLNAAAAAILLNAGIGKIIAPLAVRRALAEILPGWRDRCTIVRLRCFAVVEIAVAIGLLATVTRPASAAAVAVLGVGFAVLGARRRPPGWTNIGVGVGLAAIGIANLFVSPQHAADAIPLTAIASILLLLWTYQIPRGVPIP